MNVYNLFLQYDGVVEVVDLNVYLAALALPLLTESVLGGAMGGGGILLQG